ncbi:hypothetical protein V6N13_058885 [Hibiscus sabdariffa]|uniref:6,7-dimethyl-8-ribityllumazine synthase n=1 Tax=Hibiscus sabdariffa TaxID=183260 RepID=A0ABR2GF81_9ROSI
MGNSLRCCLACVLPCGALDLIRIVHLNGHVEEITHSVTAGDILHANPNHVLSKPTSHGVVRKVLILSPHSQLKRGGIYFLIPVSSLPAAGDKKKRHADAVRHKRSFTKTKKCHHVDVDSDSSISETKHSGRSRKDRRNSRERVWQPHLASISED